MADEKTEIKNSKQIDYGIRVEEYEGVYGIAAYFGTEEGRQKIWVDAVTARGILERVQEALKEAEEKNKTHVLN